MQAPGEILARLFIRVRSRGGFPGRPAIFPLHDRVYRHPAQERKRHDKEKIQSEPFHPMAIFKAPRFVIFAAGPVIMKAAALPMLIPSHSHC